MEEIINRVANSKLITFNLEDLYLPGKREVIDISQWLTEGFILREKDFRESLKNYDWSVYQDTFVALSCSTDAIVPAWAFMLVSTYLQPVAKKIVVGTLTDLETVLYAEEIQKLDVSEYRDQYVIIKGCSNKPVPQNAYILLTQKLQATVKNLMFGEACSSVPLYKSK
ncbi:DUF2480 family protein [Leeuwenhoekiella sp. W20_SRS_FM14]|uniref:DUF2480 family protein n=1 Tax=Leeuwenhoekiella sp. W20_SRS_FM14 TaxID=3240270 RepID=UPI003F976CD9